VAKKKKKAAQQDGPSTSAAAIPAERKDDPVVIAESAFARGDLATTRQLLPTLRAAGATAKADALWEKTKIDPVQLAVGLGAALVAALAALLTLR
jgi:hypothetical protein